VCAEDYAHWRRHFNSRLQSTSLLALSMELNYYNFCNSHYWHIYFQLYMHTKVHKKFLHLFLSRGVPAHRYPFEFRFTYVITACRYSTSYGPFN
jgi:hypothetical protein